MFKLSTCLVALGLLTAAPAFAQAPATAPATPAKPITDTVKGAADKAKSAVESTKDKVTDKAQAAANTALIDINTASVEVLSSLHGIGPVRAEAIVKGRPYKGKNDLLTKKIIPENVYDGIKDQIIAKQK